MRLYYYASGDEATAILERGFRDTAYHLDMLDPTIETPAVLLFEDAPKKSDVLVGAVLEVTLCLPEEELSRLARKAERYGRREWFVPAALLGAHGAPRIIALGERKWEERHAGSIIVDPEFAALIPPLSDEEDSALGHSISRYGCRDALVVWPTPEGDILLDGHNRYRHCAFNKTPFAVVAAPYVRTRDDAIGWMIDNQLARRNLPPEHRAFLMGKRYNQSKVRTAFRGNQHTAGIHHRDGGHAADLGPTAQRLAQEYKVSVPTIERAGQFAAAIETLAENVGPQVVGTLTGKSPLSRQEVVALAQAAPAEQERVFSFATDGEVKAAARQIQEREKAARAQVRANVATLEENESEKNKQAQAHYAAYKKDTFLGRVIWRAHSLLGVPPADAAALTIRFGLLDAFVQNNKEAVDALIEWLQDYSRALGRHLGPQPLLHPEPRTLHAVPLPRQSSVPEGDADEDGSSVSEGEE